MRAYAYARHFRAHSTEVCFAYFRHETPSGLQWFYVRSCNPYHQGARGHVEEFTVMVNMSVCQCAEKKLFMLFPVLTIREPSLCLTKIE